MSAAADARRRLLKGALGVPALAGSAAMLAGCASSRLRTVRELPATVPVRAPLPGTRWRYHEVNVYNGLVLDDLEVEVVSAAPLVLRHARVNPRANAGRIAAPAGPVEARYAEPWSIVVDPGFVRVLRFGRAVPLLPPASSPATVVDTDTTFTVADDSGTYRWSQRLQALRSETLVTPAGRFDCLVVQRDIRFESPDPFSFDHRRRETRWYAPAIDGWVRREWTGDYIDSGHLDDRLGRRREDWVRLELQSYLPAPLGAAPRG